MIDSWETVHWQIVGFKHFSNGWDNQTVWDRDIVIQVWRQLKSFLWSYEVIVIKTNNERRSYLSFKKNC